MTPSASRPERPRPVRRRLAPDDRRQALLDAALTLFNTKQYDDVSVDDIAATAGMSRPLLYHYYGGKSGVFIAAMRQAGAVLVQAVEEGGTRNAETWLEDGLRAYLDCVQENPIGITALLRHGSLPGGQDREVLDEIREKIMDLIMAGLQPPVESQILRAVVRGWISTVETLCKDWLLLGEPTRGQLDTWLPDLLTTGLNLAVAHDPAVDDILTRAPRLSLAARRKSPRRRRNPPLDG